MSLSPYQTALKISILCSLVKNEFFSFAVRKIIFKKLAQCLLHTHYSGAVFKSPIYEY